MNDSLIAENPPPPKDFLSLAKERWAIITWTLSIVLAVLWFLYKANLFAAIGYGFVDGSMIKDVRDDVGRLEKKMDDFDKKIDHRFDKIDGRLDSITNQFSSLTNNQSKSEAVLSAHIVEDRLRFHFLGEGDKSPTSSPIPPSTPKDGSEVAQ